MEYLSIQDITPVAVAEVWDISLDEGDVYQDEPNFIANGIVLHNCHASGVVISDVPLAEIAPLRTAKVTGDEITYATQFAYEDLELLGLIKFDILAISTLTVIARCVQMVKDNYGIELDIENLPLEDKKTLDLYRTGKLTGVFQCESDPMQRTCMDIGVDRFDDIMAAISLFRPGPMDSIPEYCDRKWGRKKISYFHPTIEPLVKDVLASTYGVLCAHEDTLVAMSDGTLKNICEVRIGDRVCALSKNKSFQGNNLYGRESVSNIFTSNLVTAIAPTVFGKGKTLTLSNGADITLTDNHPVMTPDGWRNCGNLVVGDLVAYANHLPVEERNGHIAQWLGEDEDVAYLLGQITGDGATGVGCSVACGSEKLADALSKWITARLPLMNVHSYHHERCWYLSLSCPILANKVGYGNRKTKWHLLLEHYGLKNDCYAKTVHEDILSARPSVRAAFLAGLFDSDGHWSPRGCSISSVSCRLRNGIERILQSFDIECSKNDTHVLIYGQQKLRSVLSPYLLNKRIGQQALSGETVGFYPLEYVRQEWMRSGLSSREFATKHGIARSVLRKNRSHCDSKTARKAGFELGDIRYYRIEKINEVDGQQFYDISVEGNENFVGNGVVLHNCYQEQVMRLCGTLGDMTPTEALVVIKGIGKKKEDVIQKGHKTFVEGAVRKGVQRDVTEQYWTKFIMPFAGYGFNASHACAYAYLSYQTAYLKANFPEEFICSYLNVEMIRRKWERVGDLEREAARMGIFILPRDINKCEREYTIVRKKDETAGITRSEIRPCVFCKGLPTMAGENLVDNRPYASPRDIAMKTDTSCVDAESVSALCDAGFFKMKKEKLLHEFEMIRDDLKQARKRGRDSDNIFGN